MPSGCPRCGELEHLSRIHNGKMIKCERCEGIWTDDELQWFDE